MPFEKTPRFMECDILGVEDQTNFGLDPEDLTTKISKSNLFLPNLKHFIPMGTSDRTTTLTPLFYLEYPEHLQTSDDFLKQL